MFRSTSTYTTGSSSADAGIWLIIAAIIALIGGILVHFLFVKSKKEPTNKFLIWLKDFLAFKIMWIETLLKIIYYIATIYVVLASFSMISVSFLSFLLMLILAPIGIRLLYEALMMGIMIWRNTQDLATNTEK